MGAAGAGQAREAPTERREGLSCANAPAKWLSERPANRVEHRQPALANLGPVLARRQGTAQGAVPQGSGPDADCAQGVARTYRRLPNDLGITADMGRPLPNIYRDLMNVDLTPDQRAMVKRAIESGRFTHEEEAVQEALALWEERERRRLEILAALDEAEASLARGEGRPITEDSMKALAEDIKERGRRRLATEGSASH